ncbi:MAG: hypothetical protein ACM31L_19275 [Actinomycetota bacterium]
MRRLMVPVAMAMALGACSTLPRPLVPDTPDGPASYICYNSMLSDPPEVRSLAERQCSRSGLAVSGLIGQQFTPLRCGLLTPTVAAFSCGRPGQAPAAPTAAVAPAAPAPDAAPAGQ